MNRTRKNLLHLYADITEYAAGKVCDYGLPRCDLGDIVSEAYLKAQAKLPRHMPRKSRNELFKNIAWCAVIDELERRNRIAALHEKYDLRLDADKPATGDEGDDGPENDGFAISDEGAGAEAVRRFDVPEDESGQEWIYDFRDRYMKTHGKPRRILDRFKKVWDPEIVRQELGFKRRYFYRLLKNLQIRFDQCFQAYHAWLAEKSLRVC